MLSQLTKFLLLLAALGCALLLLAKPNSALYLSVVSDDAVASYHLSLDGATQHLEPPADYPFLTMFTDQYSAFYGPVVGWFTAYFRLSEVAHELDIRLVSPRETVTLQAICLHNRQRQQCWASEQLVQQFRFSSGYQLDSDDHLVLLSAQPTLHWLGDFQAVQAEFLVPDRGYQLQLLLLLGIAVAALVLLDVNRQRVWNALRHPTQLSAPTLFVILALPFGLAILMVNPLMQAPDELFHVFKTASAAGELDLRAQEAASSRFAKLPVNGITALHELYYSVRYRGAFPDPAVLRYFDQTPANMQHTYDYCPPFGDHQKRYSWFPYYPAAIGFQHAVQLNLPWPSVFYAARLSNFLVWLLCIWLAIRLVPVGKWVLLALALTPMSVFIATSISPDALTNGLSFLFIASVLKLSFSPVALRYWLLALSVLIMLALAKLPYLSLAALLVLPLLHQKHYVQQYAWRFAALVVGIVALGWGLWQMFTHAGSQGMVPIAEQQLEYILRQPFSYLYMVGDSLLHAIRAENLLHQFVGIFGWLEVPLPTWLVWLHFAVLALYAVTDNHADKAFSLSARGWMGLVFTLGVLAVVTALYFIETPTLVSRFVDGLQGRYFIPLAPVLLLPLGVPKLTMPTGFHARLSIGYVPLSLLVSVAVIWRYYY